MNYSSRFRNGVSTLLNSSISRATRMEDYDGNKVFCYIKNVGNLYPNMLNSHYTETVSPILCDYEETKQVEKAEDILSVAHNFSYISRCTLNDELFYTGYGILFDKDKIPLLVNCNVVVPGETSLYTLCINTNIFKRRDAPMQRFILRKLIPYMADYNFDFTFFNCSAFILLPKFQGKLDKELVGEFLADELEKEFSRKDPSYKPHEGRAYETPF